MVVRILLQYVGSSSETVAMSAKSSMLEWLQLRSKEAAAVKQHIVGCRG